MAHYGLREFGQDVVVVGGGGLAIVGSFIVGGAIVSGSIGIVTRPHAAVASVESQYPPCDAADKVEILGNGRSAEIAAAKMGKDAVCVAGSNLFEVEG